MIGSFRSLWRPRTVAAAAAAVILGGVTLAKNSDSHHHGEKRLPEVPGVYFDRRVVKEDPEIYAKARLQAFGLSLLLAIPPSIFSFYIVKLGAKYTPKTWLTVGPILRIVTTGALIGKCFSEAFKVSNGVVTEMELNDDKETVTIKSGILFSQVQRVNIRSMSKINLDSEHKDVIDFKGESANTGRMRKFRLLADGKHVNGGEIIHNKLLEDIITGNSVAVKKYKSKSAYAAQSYLDSHSHGHAHAHGSHGKNQGHPSTIDNYSHDNAVAAKDAKAHH